MKLSQCTLGRLLVPKDTWEINPKKNKVGMVMGLTQNCTGEAIPLIKFSDEDVPRGYHHSQLKPYEE